MLTLAKIETYRAFNGDIDGYVRSNGRGDSSGITEGDWALIDRLVMAIQTMACGQAGESFAARVKKELAVYAPLPEQRAALTQLAHGKHFG